MAPDEFPWFDPSVPIGWTLACLGDTAELPIIARDALAAVSAGRTRPVTEPVDLYEGRRRSDPDTEDIPAVGAC